MRSGSKTESAYDDDFETISKSHISASHLSGSRKGGKMRSSAEGLSTTLDPPAKTSDFRDSTPKDTGSDKKKSATFSSKRKSAEALEEKYSPIKEAKHRDEHSLEGLEDESSGEGDDYTSVDNSESTMKHKYSNAQKSRQHIGMDDSVASSSYMMSSAGKDQSLKKVGRTHSSGGKTHIDVGQIAYN